MSGQAQGDCCFCNENLLSPTSEPYRDPSLEQRCDENQAIQSKLLYRPLSVHETRLLEIQASSTQTPLVGRLFAAVPEVDVAYFPELNCHKEFLAISYYWGKDRTPEYHFKCNDITYPIPLQAYRALHRIRNSHQPRYVWIDTVCINQHDEREKEQQVAKMCSIYQSARQVVVYLGEYSSGAAKFLLDIMHDYEDAQGDWVPIARDRIDRIKYDQEGPFCETHVDLIIDGLQELTEIPWFTRMWIKQELWAARSVEVLRGASIFPWTMLDPSRFILSDLKDHIPRQRQEAMQTLSTRFRQLIQPLEIGSAEDHANAKTKGIRNPFLDLEQDRDIVSVLIAVQSDAAECANPRDYVYALLGMTNISTTGPQYNAPNAFQIDYKEPAVNTFKRLAEHIIVRDNSLFILFLSDAFPRRDGSGVVDGQVLPSWVPDWRDPIGLVLRPRERARQYFERSAKSRNVQVHDNTISTCGRRVGRLGSELQLNYTDDASRLFWERLVRWRDLPETAQPLDEVVILDSTHLPVLLRPINNGSASNFFYVGPLGPHDWLIGSYEIPDTFEAEITKVPMMRVFLL